MVQCFLPADTRAGGSTVAGVKWSPHHPRTHNLCTQQHTLGSLGDPKLLWSLWPFIGLRHDSGTVTLHLQYRSTLQTPGKAMPTSLSTCSHSIAFLKACCKGVRNCTRCTLCPTWKWLGSLFRARGCLHWCQSWRTVLLIVLHGTSGSVSSLPAAVLRSKGTRRLPQGSCLCALQGGVVRTSGLQSGTMSGCTNMSSESPHIPFGSPCTSWIVPFTKIVLHQDLTKAHNLTWKIRLA